MTPVTRRLLAAVAVLACPLLAAPTAAQPTPAGRPLAIEDYYRIQTVTGPEMSPDGRWVFFTIGTRIEEDNSTRSEVHLVPVDGSARPQRLLHYGKDIAGPSWTNDNRLQYSAERQHWSIDPASPAGAPRPTASPVAGAVPSPDGTRIALTRDKPQSKPDTAAMTDFERRHEERFKGITFDWKDFQRDGQPFPAPNLRAGPVAELIVQQVGSPITTTLVDLDLRPANIAWHPGGALLAFTADPDWRDELKYEAAELWTVTTGGVVTRLTDDGYVYSNPQFSPDGRFLSFVRTFGTDMIIEQKLNHGGPRDLYVRPVAGGDPINLTASWDLEPSDVRWAPDSRHVYFTAAIGGEVQLFRVAAPGSDETSVPPTFAVEQVTTGPRRLGSVTFDRDMTSMAYTLGLHESPPEVYVANIDGSNERRLSDVHTGVTSEIAFSPAERLQWASPDGTRIEGWLLLPHGYDPARGPYPLVVNSHGGPHAAVGYSFDFKKQYFAAKGYFVLDTNFRSSTGYGDDFKWATWGEWGTKDGQDVVAGIDHVLERYPIDPRRVGHIGHSYGGFMTNWLITQYPDRFAAAVSGAGISNWMSDYGTADIYRTKETEFFGTPWDAGARERMIKQSPLSYAGNVRTPTLFVHGEVDQRVPYEEGEQMYFALRRRGIPATMIRYADQAHSISGHWNNVHRMLNELQWFDRYLGPAATTTSAQP